MRAVFEARKKRWCRVYCPQSKAYLREFLKSSDSRVPCPRQYQTPVKKNNKMIIIIIIIIIIINKITMIIIIFIQRLYFSVLSASQYKSGQRVLVIYLGLLLVTTLKSAVLCSPKRKTHYKEAQRLIKASDISILCCRRKLLSCALTPSAWHSHRFAHSSNENLRT